MLRPISNIPVSAIRPHKSEGGHYPKRIEEYQNDIRNGKDIPPIHLIKINKNNYHIDDGHHRYQAHKLENKTHIKAIVISHKTGKHIKEDVPTNSTGPNIAGTNNDITWKKVKSALWNRKKKMKTFKEFVEEVKK